MKNILKPPPFIRYPKPTKDGMPTVFYVETVLACNLACPECVIGTDTINRTKKIMKLEDLETISKKIEPYAKLVYLHKWGEPLMNKKIIEMISITAKYAHPHISTNAILLDKEKAEKLITSGLGTLIISIDGVSQNTYEKYRIGGQVKTVLKNIKMLAEINNYYSNPVTILPQFIVFKHNYSEVNQFKNFCEEVGLRPIFKKPYIRFGDAVQESDDKNFQREKYNNKEDHLHAISECPHATCTMTITANGQLLLCAQDYNGDWQIGNILDEGSTVENLWNESYYKHERNKIINKNPPKLCTDNCMIYNPGYTL